MAINFQQPFIAPPSAGKYAAMNSRAGRADPVGGIAAILGTLGKFRQQGIDEKRQATIDKRASDLHELRMAGLRRKQGLEGKMDAAMGIGGGGTINNVVGGAAPNAASTVSPMAPASEGGLQIRDNESLADFMGRLGEAETAQKAQVAPQAGTAAPNPQDNLDQIRMLGAAMKGDYETAAELADPDARETRMLNRSTNREIRRDAAAGAQQTGIEQVLNSPLGKELAYNEDLQAQMAEEITKAAGKLELQGLSKKDALAAAKSDFENKISGMDVSSYGPTRGKFVRDNILKNVFGRVTAGDFSAPPKEDPFALIRR